MQIIYIFAGMLIGIIIGEVFTNHHLNKMYVFKCNEAEKYEVSFMLMKEWTSKKQQGILISTILSNRGYRNVIIYGMGHVGKCLYDELYDSDINVLYSIDKDFSGNYKGSEIKQLSQLQTIENADAIIVTPLFSFNQIEDLLTKKTEAEIISIEEIIYCDM